MQMIWEYSPPLLESNTHQQQASEQCFPLIKFQKWIKGKVCTTILACPLPGRMCVSTCTSACNQLLHAPWACKWLLSFTCGLQAPDSLWLLLLPPVTVGFGHLCLIWAVQGRIVVPKGTSLLLMQHQATPLQAPEVQNGTQERPAVESVWNKRHSVAAVIPSTVRRTQLETAGFATERYFQ